jgi:hypothetical protein
MYIVPKKVERLELDQLIEKRLPLGDLFIY